MACAGVQTRSLSLESRREEWFLPHGQHGAFPIPAGAMAICEVHRRAADYN
jgi:hypothetical protein